MSDLKIQDKRERTNIIVDGVTVATAIYNPSDPLVYKKLIEIYALIENSGGKTKTLDFTEKELDEISASLESTEDYEKASAAFGRVNTVMQAFNADIDAIVGAVNFIYGDGICEILLKYGKDGEYLSALLEMTFKAANRSRQAVKGKYKAKEISGIIE